MLSIPEQSDDRAARALRTLGLALGALALGAAGGLAVAAGNPVVPFALLAALVPLPWLLTRPEADLWLVVAVITLLPFATLPLKVGVTPTFLEMALLLLAGVGLFAGSRGADVRAPGGVRTPLDGWVLLFLGVITFAFVLGLGRDSSVTVIHNYFKLLLAIILFFSAGQVLRSPAAVERCARALVGAGGLAAALGVALWALPQGLAQRVLLRLAPVGYPTDRVLRYLEDDPAKGERATGTSVDPNSFGGLLVIVVALTLSQLLGKRPCLPRPLLGALLAVELVAVLLTQSRGAEVAVAAAALLIGVLRYRRLLLVLPAGAIGVLVLGVGRSYVARLVSGLQFQDQAQLMRLAEYQNAATIIARYPGFGVGFGTAGELDLTTGVSSLYLTLAERTGLAGLTAFLAAMAAFFLLLWPWLRPRAAPLTGDAAILDAALVGAVVGVAGALIANIEDHYYFNTEQSHLAALFWLCLALALAARRLLIEFLILEGVAHGG